MEITTGVNKIDAEGLLGVGRKRYGGVNPYNMAEEVETDLYTEDDFFARISTDEDSALNSDFINSSSLYKDAYRGDLTFIDRGSGIFLIKNGDSSLGFTNAEGKAAYEFAHNLSNDSDINSLSKESQTKQVLTDSNGAVFENSSKNSNTLYGDGLNDSYISNVKKSGSMGLPDVKKALNFKAYEGYGAFGESDPTSPQYHWKSKYGDKVEFDDQGFAYLYDSEGIKTYVVAMGTYYGKVGDKFMVEMKNDDGKSSYINVVLGDIKANKHTDSSNRYQIEDSSYNILEFTGHSEEIQKAAKYTGNVSNAKELFSGEITGVYKLDDKKQDMKNYD